jgi:hypothetical protein
MRSISRPTDNEVPLFQRDYISEVSGEDISDQLLEQLEILDRVLGSIDDTKALHRYAPGKWSIKEIVGHLTDAERIFSYRLLRIARGDQTPLPGFDENTYVPPARFDTRSLASLRAELRAVRLSTISLIEGLPVDCWELMGEASGQPVSARALPYIIAGHAAHHLRVLRERYGVGSATELQPEWNSHPSLR